MIDACAYSRKMNVASEKFRWRADGVLFLGWSWIERMLSTITSTVVNSVRMFYMYQSQLMNLCENKNKIIIIIHSCAWRWVVRNSAYIQFTPIHSYKAYATASTRLERYPRKIGHFEDGWTWFINTSPSTRRHVYWIPR